MLPGRGGKSRPSILSAWGPDGYLAQATTYALSNSDAVTDPRGLTTHLTLRRTKRWRSCPSNKGRICGSLVEEHATATCRSPQQKKKKTATCRIATSLKSPQHSDEISITTALKPASSKPMWTQLVYRTVPFMLFNESKSIRPSALEARGGSFTHMKAYWRGTQCKCNGDRMD